MQPSVVAGKIPDLGAKKGEFVGIPITNMRMDAVLNTELYIKIGDGKHVKYREENYPFDGRVRERLKESGHTHIYVKIEDIKKFNEYLELNLKNTLSDQKVDTHEKTALLYDTTTYLVRELLQDPSSEENIKQSQRVVETAVDFIISNPNILSHHLELSSVDYYTYTHSVDVMTYSIILGRRVGIKEGHGLNELGQGALLHDVGKAYIDPEIINKQGTLTEDEFQTMKKHPGLGYDVLYTTGTVPGNVLHMVLYHHEDILGNGYPYGVKSTDLGLEVRIITVADIYNAMTTRRVYRKAYGYFDALKIMKDMVGLKIDERLFKEFVIMLGDIR